MQNSIIVNGSSSTWQKYKDDFCKLSTCPLCGASVFFVRHNGGSVWFDELGKPWPLYGCFDKHADVHQITWRLLKSSEGVNLPLYGLVVAVEVASDCSFDRIVVKCEDNKLATVHVTSQNDHNKLVGELVILSHIDRKIIHPSILPSSIFSFPNNADHHYNLGKFYVELGCLSDAIEEFNHSIHLRASFAKSYLELGKIYESMRQYSMPGSEKSILMKQKITEAYFSAGEAFRKMGNLPQALGAYRRVKLLAPTYPGLDQGLDCCRKKVVPSKPVASTPVQRPQVENILWRQQPALNVHHKPKPQKGQKR